MYQCMHMYCVYNYIPYMCIYNARQERRRIITRAWIILTHALSMCCVKVAHSFTFDVVPLRWKARFPVPLSSAN